MKALLHLFWLTLLLAGPALLLAGPVHAQATQPASLLADRVDILDQNRILASGHVEVFYQDARLSADSIAYDKTTGQLTIKGPITLLQGSSTIILAENAELDTDLKNGILRGARMVLEQQMQVAAAEMNRVGGRYTQLYKTVASSCQVCASRPVPLWQIRAERVIHDQQAQRLYFDKAQFLVAGVPVMYLPRLRMPDPAVKRATGLLTPSGYNNNLLGWGLKLPYFIAIGDSADITLTPFLSPHTKTLEFRYRQAFLSGDISFEGAIARDDLRPDEIRAYLFGNGTFQLPRGYELTLNANLVSDPAFLLEYGYSGQDRLENSLAATRTRASDYFIAEIVNFRTLRGLELAIDDQLPNLQGEVPYERLFNEDLLGGDGSWRLTLLGINRLSQADHLGRDELHLTGYADWGRSVVIGNGMVGRVTGALTADAYAIDQDSDYGTFVTRATPALAADLRWPLVRANSRGVREVLEPVAQIAWAQTYGGAVPNESSSLVEFDEGNLLALSRFPGSDRYETGLRATYGASWTRYDASGWSAGLTVGQVIRATDDNGFTEAAGLSGPYSDYLVAAQLKLDTRLSLTSRALVGQDFALDKSETRLTWSTDPFTISSTYSWIVADPAENRPDLISQLGLDGRYDLTRHWQSTFGARYDFQAKRPTEATFGLTYQNECIRVDLSLSRRFTSSTSVEPTTDIGFSVGLNGFGNDGRDYGRSCRG